MAMAVGRSALLFLMLSVLLFCSLAMAIPSSKDMLEEETEESMVALQQNHKHSGFSQAECPGACQFRCSKTAYRKPCMFFCQKCCFKCKCVPPGTYAHKEVCPCYNNWKTKRGGPKCP